ncbi:efflux RND transporter periplasmic adaptor subunit [Sulfurimonas marina]|uniref:Efflux RND transporter periplasmic adaptor subunit n=1 Tax=Sulfurimonas marina TaxID=2590551 RepID=A0A7M1AUL6_9BACT|nr:efflux RND transporter periplasmic adaptor subunit [Sulfurimonas marina]QOP41131.1 efflux RND transporter periplasmic adaptor subunit [Sulfurimonas marina]
MKYQLTKISLAVSLLFTTALTAKETTNPAAAAPKVDVYVVKKAKEAPVSLEYPSRITSAKDVTITARVSGVLEKQLYTEGSLVSKGTPMYKIEPDIYEAEVASKKADLNVATVQFEKAQKDWERAEGLYSEKAISEQDKDTAYFAYLSAKANVDAAHAELQKVQVNLNYTNVRATISGVTGMRMVDEGDYVTVGTALVKLTQTDPIYAEFSIPEISKLKQKYSLANGSWKELQKAKLQAVLVIDGKEYEENGRIDFIDTRVDNATSTLKARAVFKNKDAKLVAGEFAKLKLIGVVSKNVLFVPQKSVLQNPLGTIVFVVVDGKVAVRPVKIIEASGDKFIVSGVQPKDVVIVNNFFRIKPNTPVSIDKTINAQEK